MKYLLIVVVATIIATPVFAADVGVSISIGQPGFYGRLDIGDYPPPQLIYRQPMIVERVVVERPPVYLRVPPGHAKHWGKHCHKYNACGERVYFVQDNWYNQEYVPRYQEQQRRGRDEHYEQNHKDHREGNSDRGEHGRGGHGKGHGRD